MAELTPDTDLTFTHGPYTLTVAPYGASLRGLTHNNDPVITGYHGKDGKVGGQGDVLIPFPGRVSGGRYTFEGQTYQMPINDKETPSAIHGFLRTQMWDVKAQSENAITFQTVLAPDQHAGYPFALAVCITYTLSDDGLSVNFTLENTGTCDAPVAIGQHPYFTVNSPLIDADTLSLPYGSYLEYKDLLPTGNVLPVAGSPFDFRESHAIGDVKFNTCFLNPVRDDDGHTRIHLSFSENKSLTIWLDASFSYVVLYSGDPLPDDHRRKSLAIEPMTCGSDAFNHPAWGLMTLAPAQTLTATWGVTVS
jgi:aldose 1-epimerase